MKLQKKAFIYEGEEVSYENKILPNQPFYSFLYEGREDLMKAMYNLLNDYTDKDSHHNFKLSEHHRVKFEEMSSPPVQLALLKFLIEMIGAKTFLEIGAFIGNTTMHVSKMMGEGSKVVTIEKFDEFAELAKQNFEQNGMLDSIELKLGDANDIMESLPDNYFDIIYVDGDKAKYLELTQIAERKISDKGIILVDDVFFHGDVFNDEPTTEKGDGCKAVLDYYKDAKDFTKYILPFNNGVLLLKRK